MAADSSSSLPWLGRPLAFVPSINLRYRGSIRRFLRPSISSLSSPSSLDPSILLGLLEIVKLEFAIPQHSKLALAIPDSHDPQHPIITPFLFEYIDNNVPIYDLRVYDSNNVGSADSSKIIPVPEPIESLHKRKSISPPPLPNTNTNNGSNNKITSMNTGISDKPSTSDSSIDTASLPSISKSVGTVVALWSFDGRSPSELSFKSGTQIFVESRYDQHWLKGEILVNNEETGSLTRKRGFFPAAWVSGLDKITNIPNVHKVGDSPHDDSESQKDKKANEVSNGEYFQDNEYFDSYASMYIHHQMLRDWTRTIRYACAAFGLGEAYVLKLYESYVADNPNHSDHSPPTALEYALGKASKDLALNHNISIQPVNSDDNNNNDDSNNPVDNSLISTDHGIFNKSSIIPSLSDEIPHSQLLNPERPLQLEQLVNLAKQASLVRGKVVLDLGCGSGILSIFCALAGARRVYAVDASDILTIAATRLFDSNRLSHIITPCPGKIEEITLPDQVTHVDVIISEWMGTFLICESMIESALIARNRFLHKDKNDNNKYLGTMLPSSASILLAPVHCSEIYKSKVDWWNNVYGIDYSVLVPTVKSHFFSKPIYDDTYKPEIMIAKEQTVYNIDMYTAKPEDLEKHVGPFNFSIENDVVMHGFLSWFDVFFAPNQNLQAFLPLSTGPRNTPTHWRQVLFLFEEPFDVQKGDIVRGTLTISRNQTWRRHFEVDLNFELICQADKDTDEPKISRQLHFDLWR